MVSQTLNYIICEIGGDGLVMTQMRHFFTCFNAKCDSLMLYYLIVRVNCPYIDNKCLYEVSL